MKKLLPAICLLLIFGNIHSVQSQNAYAGALIYWIGFIPIMGMGDLLP